MDVCKCCMTCRWSEMDRIVGDLRCSVFKSVVNPFFICTGENNSFEMDPRAIELVGEVKVTEKE